MAAATDGWEAEDAKPIAPRVSHGSTGSHAASGPMSLGRSSSRGSQGSAGSHGSTHHTHATKSGSGGWDDEEDDEDAGWDEGDSWQPGPSTPNPPKPSRTAPSAGGRRIEGMGSKGSRSGAACLRTSRYLRRGIICGGVLAIVVMGAAAYRYIADGGDGLHSKRLDVEFELDDQAGRSSSFGSGSSPSERLSGGASLSRLAHPNAGAGVDGYRSPADRDAVVVEEDAGDEGSTPIRAPSPKIAEALSKEETAPVKNTRVAPKAPNLDETRPTSTATSRVCADPTHRRPFPAAATTAATHARAHPMTMTRRFEKKPRVTKRRRSKSRRRRTSPGRRASTTRRRFQLRSHRRLNTRPTSPPLTQRRTATTSSSRRSPTIRTSPMIRRGPRRKRRTRNRRTRRTRRTGTGTRVPTRVPTRRPRRRRRTPRRRRRSRSSSRWRTAKITRTCPHPQSPSQSQSPNAKTLKTLKTLKTPT